MLKCSAVSKAMPPKIKVVTSFPEPLTSKVQTVQEKEGSCGVLNLIPKEIAL